MQTGLCLPSLGGGEELEEEEERTCCAGRRCPQVRERASGVPVTASPSIPSAAAERRLWGDPLPVPVPVCRCRGKGKGALGGAASSSFGGGWLGIQVKGCRPCCVLGRLGLILNVVVAGLEEKKRRIQEKSEKSKVHPELCEGS